MEVTREPEVVQVISPGTVTIKLDDAQAGRLLRVLGHVECGYETISEKLRKLGIVPDGSWNLATDNVDIVHGQHGRNAWRGGLR